MTLPHPEPGRTMVGFTHPTPLSRDCIALARPAKIHEQIKAGTFPVRLKPEEWQSEQVNWLLDVIAPDRKTAGRVIANFAQVGKTGELRLHPQIGGLVEPDLLQKMGGSRLAQPEGGWS